MLPIPDIVRIANEGADGEFPGCLRLLFQLEPYLFWQTIAFQAIDPLIRQDAVLPGGEAAARTRHDMVDVALMRSEFFARVLAVAPVSFPNSLGRKLGPPFRHLAVTGQNQDGRDSHQTADGAHCIVLFPNWKSNPILPPNRAHVADAKHVEGSGVPV